MLNKSISSNRFRSVELNPNDLDQAADLIHHIGDLVDNLQTLFGGSNHPSNLVCLIEPEEQTLDLAEVPSGALIVVPDTLSSFSLELNALDSISNDLIFGLYNKSGNDVRLQFSNEVVFANGPVSNIPVLEQGQNFSITVKNEAFFEFVYAVTSRQLFVINSNRTPEIPQQNGFEIYSGPDSPENEMGEEGAIYLEFDTPADGNLVIHQKQAGEYVLAAKINTNAILPGGGTAGQVLKKNSSGNYDVSWQDDQEGKLPSGGSAGQALVKQSNEDDDVAWQTINPSGSLTFPSSEITTNLVDFTTLAVKASGDLTFNPAASPITQIPVMIRHQSNEIPALVASSGVQLHVLGGLKQFQNAYDIQSSNNPIIASLRDNGNPKVIEIGIVGSDSKGIEVIDENGHILPYAFDFLSPSVSHELNVIRTDEDAPNGWRNNIATFHSEFKFELGESWTVEVQLQTGGQCALKLVSPGDNQNNNIQEGIISSFLTSSFMNVYQNDSQFGGGPVATSGITNSTWLGFKYDGNAETVTPIIDGEEQVAFRMEQALGNIVPQLVMKNGNHSFAVRYKRF